MSTVYTEDEIFIFDTVYFHFSSSKLIKQCFIELPGGIVQDGKNSIPSHPYSNEPNFHIKTLREGMYWSIYIFASQGFLIRTASQKKPLAFRAI